MYPGRAVWVRAAFAVVACWCAALPAAEPAARYGFSVGEQLVYEMTVDDLTKPDAPDEPSDRPHDRTTFTVTPLEQDNLGRWRLLVRTEVTLWSTSRRKEPTVRFKNEFLSYCNLAPDGGYELNSTIGATILVKLVPEWIFPPLPVASKPTRTAPAGEGVYTLTCEANGAKRLRVTGSVIPAHHEVSGLDEAVEIELEVPSGRMTRVVHDVRGTDDKPYHERTTIELASVSRLAEADVARLARESQEYFDIATAWWDSQMTAQLARSVEACQKLLDAGSEPLRAKQAESEDPDMRQLYAALLKRHARVSTHILETVAEQEQLYSQPPIDWETVTIDGEPRRRVDYAGHVVVMDFWYRRCGHCIRAMPKIKQIYANYRDRGVKVVGVNRDRDLADARHVIETAPIPYETIRDARPSDANGPAISELYHVKGWPTFIVLDQSGKIALVVRGNHDDLVDQLSQTLDKLLAQDARQ